MTNRFMQVVGSRFGTAVPVLQGTALSRFSSAMLRLLHQSHGRMDRIWMNIFVFIVWVLDTVHEILLLAAVYVYLVKDIGDLLALERDTA